MECEHGARDMRAGGAVNEERRHLNRTWEQFYKAKLCFDGDTGDTRTQLNWAAHEIVGVLLKSDLSGAFASEILELRADLTSVSAFHGFG